MNKYLSPILLMAILAACSTKTSETRMMAPLPIIAGDYDFLSVATNGERITGFYSNDRYRGNPNFGCSFYFYGNLTDSIGNRKIAIQTLNPFNLSEKPRDGSLKLHSEEDTNFYIIADPPADKCWDPHLGWTQISEPPGVEFVLFTKQPWLEIRLAKTDKVYLHADADETTRRKAYVIKNDPLFIAERQGDWLKATFKGPNSEATGWVKNSNTQSLDQVNVQ